MIPSKTADILGQGGEKPAGHRERSAPAQRGPMRLRSFVAGLPPEAWSRILILFTALGVIKIYLLLGARKHLEEIHWRVESSETTWANYLAFYLFVGLAV